VGSEAALTAKGNAVYLGNATGMHHTGASFQQSNSSSWEVADQVEIEGILDLKTWEAGGCMLLEGKQALPTHFVREVKRDGRYKSRLVVGGHKQRLGVDFIEMFAPVYLYRTMRIMLAMAAHADLVFRQFDIKTAFLHGYLKEEVFVWPPRGWEHLAGWQVLRLYRALYGLRQAPRAWHERLTSELTSRGFVQSNADPGFWILKSVDGVVLTMFYVDDILVVARTDEEAEGLVDLIASIFKTRRLEEPRDMLGIEIDRNCQAGTITIRQSEKARVLAETFGVLEKGQATPMTPAAQGSLRAERDGDVMADKERYMSGMGACYTWHSVCGLTLQHPSELSPPTALRLPPPTTPPCLMSSSMLPALPSEASHTVSQAD
jgi:hypothetical protein